MPKALDRFFYGGDDGIRTHDPHVANVVLSQLSYIPINGQDGILPLCCENVKEEFRNFSRNRAVARTRRRKEPGTRRTMLDHVLVVFFDIVFVVIGSGAGIGGVLAAVDERPEHRRPGFHVEQLDHARQNVDILV